MSGLVSLILTAVSAAALFAAIGIYAAEKRKGRP